MTLRSSDFVTAQKPILNELFDVGWMQEGDQYTNVVHVESSSDAYETDMQIQGPDEVSESTEGGMYSRLEISNVRTKTYTHILYKNELKITREAIEDLKYKKIYDAVKYLGNAAKRTVERKVANCLANGFSAELTPDGSAVFSSHTLAQPQPGRPTTYNNSTTGALNAARLKTGRSKLRKFLDENGSINPMKGTKLIVTPELEWTAAQLQQSVLEPGTANNDKNVVSKNLDVVVMDYLAEAASNADTCWFLQDPVMHQFKLFWRVKPEQEMIHEEASGDVLYRIRMRFSVGFSHYQGIYGSTGAVA